MRTLGDFGSLVGRRGDVASTADLMKRFYGQLRAGRSKDEALRAAQAALIRSPEFSHPYHWAAFLLAGDWK